MGMELSSKELVTPRECSVGFKPTPTKSIKASIEATIVDQKSLTLESSAFWPSQRAGVVL